MNRLFLITAAALAATGLAHNPSFSHQLPVRAPSGAQSVEAGEDSALTVRSLTPSNSAVRSAHPSATPSRSRTAEPGDDGGGDRGGASSEQGDDHGGSSGSGSSGSGSSGGDSSGKNGSHDG